MSPDCVMMLLGFASLWRRGGRETLGHEGFSSTRKRGLASRPAERSAAQRKLLLARCSQVESLFVLGPIAIGLESLIGDLLEYLDCLRSQWDRDFAGLERGPDFGALGSDGSTIRISGLTRLPLAVACFRQFHFCTCFVIRDICEFGRRRFCTGRCLKKLSRLFASFDREVVQHLLR